MSEVTRQLKKERRRVFRSKLQAALSRQDNFSSSFQLTQLLSRFTFWQEQVVVASYKSLPGEISLLPFEKKYSHKLCFVYPKMKARKCCFVCPDKTAQWEKGPWPKGYQPSSGREMPLDQISFFLVPGLAFDRRGYRLGRGGGFYDRVLSQSPGIKIGIASSSQISNQDIPVENHDIKMDAVVTDSYFFIPLKYTHFLKGVY